MRACLSCATELPEGARFCMSCGASQVTPGCVSCGADLPVGARFCLECGAPQAGGPAARGGAEPSVARRVTSVLFGDLVGFTALSESRDQEDVRDLLSAYFEQCRRVIARYGGTVEKFIGDAVMAVWGVPTAHEDDAERAVRAGLELVSAVEAMGAEPGIPDLAMRVGIVTGEVAVTVGAEGQGMVAGDAVNTAARVQSAAAPGQIWVDETTRLLTTASISFVDVGSHELKGKADPVPLWAVRAVVAGMGGSQRADGLEAPLVGRDRELRLVKELFHQVDESGRPALLVVDGEPGVGKSRLGWEFEKYSDGLNEVTRWYQGRCLAYGEGFAYHALAEAIRARLLSLGSEDDAEQSPSTLLELGLEQYVPDVAERDWLRPRLGALLGVGAVGNHAREDLFAAWCRFLHRTSEDKYPVVLMIDDAQHADEGLLQFLEHLLAVGRFGCLVLLLTRPGLLEQHPDLATNRAATVAHLHPVADREMATLLDGLVAGLPDEVRSSLVARSEGVPLFAVETVRSLIDRDLVVPRGGQYVLAEADVDLDAIGAPASLQALIAARLDTLDAGQRQLVDRASIIGEAFTRDQIDQLCPALEDVGAVLAGLVRIQFLRQESSRFTTEHGQFQFVQGAVRQVAYGSLSKRDRKQGHLAVVEVLQPEGDVAPDRASIVAQHLLGALDAVPDAPDADVLATRAVSMLRSAAKRAQALGAPEEAVLHLTSALGRCADPELRPRVESDLAEALEQSGRAEDSIVHAERAAADLDAQGDRDGAGRAVALLSKALTAVGRYERGGQLAAERYQQVRADGTMPEVEFELLRARLSAETASGASAVGAEVLELCRLAEYLGGRQEIGLALGALGQSLLSEGSITAGRLLMEGEADAARAGHDSLRAARVLLNLNAQLNGDDTVQATDYGREGLAAARVLGHRSLISNGAINLLMSLAMRGEWPEAVSLTTEDGLIREIDAPYQEMCLAFIRGARGEVWSPGEAYLRESFEEDELSAAVRLLVNAMQSSGTSQAVVELATSACRNVLDLSGYYDDFGVVMNIAMDLLVRLGSHEGLAALVALVEEHGERRRPPAAVRFARHRARAHLGVASGSPATEVEGEFSQAMQDVDAWRSPVWRARLCADLAAWAGREGLLELAEARRREARGLYEELGATGWIEQLEADTSGTRA